MVRSGGTCWSGCSGAGTADDGCIRTGCMVSPATRARSLYLREVVVLERINAAFAHDAEFPTNLTVIAEWLLAAAANRGIPL
jgi:hypothetical protein